MRKKLILMFSGSGANDAIRGLMQEYSDALTTVGMSVVHMTSEPAELQYAVEQISLGNVGFAVTWLGFGQDLSASIGPEQRVANVWEAFRIPLLKLHGDLPAYFSNRHRDTPSTAVNLYHAQEFAQFRRRWLPDARTLAAVIPPLPLSPLQRSEVDLRKRREGKLVFVKNGNSPAELRRLWSERLPPSTSRMIADLAAEIVPVGLKPGPLHIGDFVADFLDAQRIDPNSTLDLLMFLSAQMDDYLRRLKSTMIAESILDFPVLVQGSLWDHLDFGGRKARLVGGLDFDATRRIFTEQMGIIDMSPNVDTWPHDRTQRAAGNYSTLLTNAQGWISDKFEGFADLTFEFNPDSIKARVADALAHPDQYLELGVAFGERFRELYTRDAFANRLVDLAELATLQYGAQKPMIQPFFAWPQH